MYQKFIEKNTTHRKNCLLGLQVISLIANEIYLYILDVESISATASYSESGLVAAIAELAEDCSKEKLRSLQTEDIFKIYQHLNSMTHTVVSALRTKCSPERTLKKWECYPVLDWIAWLFGVLGDRSAINICINWEQTRIWWDFGLHMFV